MAARLVAAVMTTILAFSLVLESIVFFSMHYSTPNHLNDLYPGACAAPGTIEGPGR